MATEMRSAFRDYLSRVAQWRAKSRGTTATEMLLITLAPYHRNDWHNMTEMAGTMATELSKCIKTYQVHVLTELASLGLACILLNVNTKKEITEVTRRGDKADYWVGERESLIEISGQQEGDIDSLCTVKSTQLLQNPFGKSGYVCVANYDENKARLWYYENN